MYRQDVDQRLTLDAPPRWRDVAPLPEREADSSCPIKGTGLLSLMTVPLLLHWRSGMEEGAGRAVFIYQTKQIYKILLLFYNNYLQRLLYGQLILRYNDDFSLYWTHRCSSYTSLIYFVASRKFQESGSSRGFESTEPPHAYIFRAFRSTVV